METRLSRICDTLIEAGWLIALIVTPLFFNTYSSRVFEPDKLHLLRSIALLVAVVWIIQLLDGGWRRSGGDNVSLWTRIRSTPLVLPALVLVAAYLISTVFSLVPRVSFFGSYVRLQGTYSFLSYVILFGAVLTHLRTRAQLNRLFHAIILTSVPICLYGMLQHYGLDPLPWGGDVQERVAGNMGNAIFVAAYLIIAFFLTVERLVDSVAGILSEDHLHDVLRALIYMFILGLQIITIIFTQSRGPWLGWFAGIYVFCMLGLRLLGRWGKANPRAPAWLPQAVRPAYFGLIALTVAGIALLIIVNLPQGPLSGLRQVRYVGRMATLLNCDEGTNAVRCLIWEGVVDMMIKPHAPLQFPAGTPAPWWASGGGTQTAASDTLNPVRWLIGYGPESMWVSYNRFYPPDLAHYEARNASPDRSHNETFDALVRTGLLGLGAQLAVFGSIFYFALRWLGLVRGRRRRNLFIALLVGGALLGVIIPPLVDHSLRLIGIGMPAGLIAGLILYVTLDLLWEPRAIEDKATEAAGTVVGSPMGGRRPLLILAIFSALVAHFAEVHFGIAIVSTLTHFWILAAALVVIGMGWLREDEAPVVATAAAVLPEAERQRQIAQPALATAGARPGKAKASSRVDSARSQAGASRGNGRGRERHQHGPERTAHLHSAQPNSWQAFLPYAAIGGIVTMVLVWNYAINQSGLHGAFNILWSAFTTRIDTHTRQVSGSAWLLVMVLITWVVGAISALAEVCREKNWRDTRFRWGTNAAIYAGVVLVMFFLYGAWQAGLTDISYISAGLEVFKHISNYLLLFDVVLLVMGLLLALGLRFASTRPQPAEWFGSLPALSLGLGGVLVAVVLAVIADTNVQIVQSDIYFKQGLAYEDAGQWEGAIVLYDQAAQMEPKEDYYYLFLGRALLEYSSSAQDGTTTLPSDFSQIRTADLLRVAEGGVANRSREDLIRASYAVLTAAQRLNPLNMDHAANLARLFRSWAFTKSVSSDQAPNNTSLRQLVQTHPEQVDLPKLDQSLKYYEQATSLSPQNTQFWNEQASVRFIKGDTQGAVADLDRSIALDKKYYQTYLLKGDILGYAGDKQGALDAYRAAAVLRPNDTQVLNAVGVYSAQVGDTQGALDSFGKIIEMEKSDLATIQKQLSDLNAKTAAGGNTAAASSSDAQRQSLQNSINTHRNLLQSTYRNQALVLRDAHQTSEALAAAQTALTYASDDQKAALNQLIADLQKQQTQ